MQTCSAMMLRNPIKCRQREAEVKLHVLSADTRNLQYKNQNTRTHRSLQFRLRSGYILV